MRTNQINSHWYLGYELKRAYQRNYLLSLAVVCVLALLLVLAHFLFLDHQKSNHKVKIILDHTFFTDMKILTAYSSYAGNGRALNLTLSKPAEDDFIEGYIGQYTLTGNDNKIREIPTGYSFVRNYEPAFIEDTPGALGLVLGDGQDLYVGSGGGEDDYESAKMQPFMPVNRAYYVESRLGAIKFMSSQPALVQIPEPRWPPRANYSDTGYVEIDLLIDSKGYISWNVIDETPRGYGFASELIEALKHGRYIPAIIKGDKAECRMRLNCTFCYGCTPSLTSSSTDVLTKLLR